MLMMHHPKIIPPLPPPREVVDQEEYLWLIHHFLALLTALNSPLQCSSSTMNSNDTLRIHKFKRASQFSS